MSAQLTAILATDTGQIIGYGIYGPGPRTPFGSGKLKDGLCQAVVARVSLGGSFEDDVSQLARDMLSRPGFAHIVASMREAGEWRWDEPPSPGLYHEPPSPGLYHIAVGDGGERLCAVFKSEGGETLVHFEGADPVKWGSHAPSQLAAPVYYRAVIPF